MTCLATALVATGCGGGKDDEDDVRRYLESVNRIERAAAPDVERANDAYTSFTRGRLPARAAVTRLREADIGIRDVREQLGRLQPPADAKPLHEKMGRLYDQVLDFTRQTAVLAGYQAGADSALEPVAGANRDLRRGLRRSKTPRAQARVLGRFTGRIGGVVEQLRNLEVPRVLAVSHGDQVRRLSATRRLAARLRRALLDADGALVARLLERFGEDPGGRPRFGLARRAITEYNERHRRLNRAYGDVSREYNRLKRAL